MSLPAGMIQIELFEQPEVVRVKKKREFKNPRLNDGLFSSDKCEWATPVDFFNKLDSEFGFELDVCALPENSKCERFFTPEDDGLKQEWKGVCWLNPPYGREIGKWIRKAYESSLKGATVVCLIPARTCTTWWHDYCMKSAEIRFVKGRLKFNGVNDNAPFPNAVVIFKPGEHELKVVSMER